MFQLEVRDLLVRMFVIVVGVLTFSANAYAEFNNHFGVGIHDEFPSASGIIFPSLFTAVGVNPAALPQPEEVSGISASFSPPPGGSGANEYGLSVASGDKSFGWGVNYEGSYQGSAISGIDAGIGFRTYSAAMGLAVRDSNVIGGTPETDLGILSGFDGPITLGVVLYHIDTSPQADLGIGFSESKRYNFELNFLLPAITDITKPGANYQVTAASTVYLGIFGLKLITSAQSQAPTLYQSVSVAVKLSRRVFLNAQYDTPNRTFFGFTYLF